MQNKWRFPAVVLISLLVLSATPLLGFEPQTVPVALDRRALGQGVLGLYYKGQLAQAPQLTLHYGYDGWQGVKGLAMLKRSDGWWQALLQDAGNKQEVNFVFSDGTTWDNSAGRNYKRRLRTRIFDAHTHIGDGTNRGQPQLTPENFVQAAQAFGVDVALTSWLDNETTRQWASTYQWLRPIAWGNPADSSSPAKVESYLRDHGFVGIKFHPPTTGVSADDPRMDPFMELARRYQVPVVIHSSPGPADPDKIRTLEKRFPDVPVIAYHIYIYLGPSADGGKQRAARHAQQQPNFYLESSWNHSAHLLDSISIAGIDKVLFGSDLATDGVVHYQRQPPNVEGVETYEQVYEALVKSLSRQDLQKVMWRNTKALFRLAEADEDIWWDGLTHDPARVVPGINEKYRVISTNTIKVWLQAWDRDLTSANVKYSEDKGASWKWAALQTAHHFGRYLCWQAVLPIQTPGAQMVYRIQVNDLNNSDWLAPDAQGKTTISQEEPDRFWSTTSENLVDN